MHPVNRTPAVIAAAAAMLIGVAVTGCAPKPDAAAPGATASANTKPEDRGAVEMPAGVTPPPPAAAPAQAPAPQPAGNSGN